MEGKRKRQYRVGTSPISFSGNYPSMGVSTCRSVCDKSQLQTPSVTDPKAYAVDAMSFPWEGMFAYAFPPFRFLSAVLRKISVEQCLIILIAPTKMIAKKKDFYC
jgi:hypothetical protein